MPTVRYPVLIWQDAAGGFTAVAIDESDLAGYGPTEAAARQDLRDFLEWRSAQAPYLSETVFRQASLQILKIAVRPEYRTPQRIYPSEHPVTLRVHCVTGVEENGQLVAALPLFGANFVYHEDAALKSLVQRFVQQQLEGATPEQIVRFLAPPHVELSDIVVRVPREIHEKDEAGAPRVLTEVAEPIGERSVRKQYARAWEREVELPLLIRKLAVERANVLLVGEPGCGKTTLLVEAVRLIEERLAEEDKQSGETQQPRRFWLTAGGRLIAGMKYLGQWEERCEAVIAALGAIQGALCVDRLLDLVRTGGREPTDSIASFLMPYMQRGEVRLVGEATPGEIDACRRLLPGFVDLFQVIPVPAFDRSKTLRVLDRLISGRKADLHIEVATGTSDRVVQMFRRFAPYEVFPGKAVGFTRDLLERGARERKREVTPADAVSQFMDRTGLPELFLRDEMSLERDSVLKAFRAQVIDQEEPCQAAANLVMTFKAGMNDPNRPVGVLLFCGPTGVGKTELAQALARYFFGNAESKTRPSDSSIPHSEYRIPHSRLVRLDMSEFSGVDAANRLIGSPDGEPSDLIRKVRQQPFCVVLLDEIEKASPEVFDVLMGVFDEGRLTDRYGRLTSFRSALIVMTSNLGADKQSAYGFDATGELSRPRYRDEAMAYFRPEFFNRLDAVVTFSPLGPETVKAITRKELRAIERREGLERAGLRVNWSDHLVEQLAKAGFDARYGARPLQRTLERTVVAPLAKFLLQHPGLSDAVLNSDWTDTGGVSFQVTRNSTESST